MSTVVERLELLLTGNAKDAVAAIRQTQAAAVDLDSSTGQVQKRMGFLGAAAQTAGQHIQQNIGMYSVAAVGALAAAGAASINEFTSLAEKVRDFSRASGASADTSSRLVAIFDDLEVSQAAADTGFFRLNRTIAENADELEQYGVKVKTAKDGSTDIYATLLSVADAYEDAEDSATRAALVQEAFGKGGKDLIPILEKGRDGIREMYDAVPDGQILDQGQIDRAREFELAVDNLSDAFQELKIAAGGELVGPLAGFINYSADAIRTANEARGSMLGFAGSVGGPLKDAFVDSIPVIGPTVGLMRDVGSVFGFGKEESDKFADAQTRLSEAQAEVARLASDETTKQSELNAAQRELTAAKNEYEGVTRRVSAALGENTSKIIENQNAAAMYTNAQLGLTGAQLNVEAATARYNQTLAENGADALETRQAAQNLEVQYEALRVATINAAVQGGAKQEEAAAQSVAALEWVAGTLDPNSPLRVHLEQYIARLHGIPAEVGTTLRIRTLLQDIVGADVTGAYGGSVPPGAEGAIVNRPTVALIGEAGPEAVIPLNRTPGNAPLPSGIGRASAAGGGTVMFVIEGQVLGRASLDAINEAAKAGGVIRAEAIIT